MVTCLPKVVDPLLLADRKASLEGSLPLTEFSRLSELLYDQKGEVAVHLLFSRVDGLPKISGQVSAAVELKCQRCLEAIDWPIDVAINLGLVNSLEQANRLSDDVEPLLINEDKMLLSDIIEDELLLNIPAIPKHEYDCSIYISETQQVSTEKNIRSASENPFSKLAVLKKTEK